jgi:hypothetical protein
MPGKIPLRQDLFQYQLVGVLSQRALFVWFLAAKVDGVDDDVARELGGFIWAIGQGITSTV